MLVDKLSVISDISGLRSSGLRVWPCEHSWTEPHQHLWGSLQRQKPFHVGPGTPDTTGVVTLVRPQAWEIV